MTEPAAPAGGFPGSSVAEDAVVVAVAATIDAARVVTLAPDATGVLDESGRSAPTADADVVVLRGDANYWAVARALAALGAAPTTVVVVAHTAWPTERRDHYRDPAALPAAAVHPATAHLAVRPSRAVPGREGLRGEPGSAWAIREGGSRNGVRTAVEDHVGATEGSHVRFLPVGTGVAVLWRADAPFAAELAERLDGWMEGSVFAAVDEERRARLDRIAELEARLAGAGDAGPRLRGENERLRARVRELEEALAVIEEDAAQLAYSAVLRAVDLVERPARRRRPGASFRARLATIRDRAAAARRDG